MNRLGVALACLLFTSILIAEDPEQKNPQPWDAAADMQALSGKWKLTPEIRGFQQKDEAGKLTFERALANPDAVLIIDSDKFAFVQTPFHGDVTNKHNQIEFIPERWYNTLEPRLKFTCGEDQEHQVSYLVEGDVLRIRYPANSCSRSGMRYTFERVKE